MPTARGWVVAACGGVVLSSGRVLGAGGLEQIGFGLFALVLIASGIVLLARHDLDVTRGVAPVRARAGQPVIVTVTVTNRGKGPARIALMEDRLPTGVSGDPRFALHGVPPAGRRAASYEVRCARRGIYEIGPVRASFLDPFGLARVRTDLGAVTSLVMHPHVVPLAMPREDDNRRSVASSSLRQPTGARGEDFFTLRDYAEGDDLRKIHWPSTAKRGRYMIRQEETPWHTKATIILDDDATSYHGDDFERAVEAAASVADLYHRSGFSYRLLGAAHPGTPAARGAHHLRRCLDTLATMEPLGAPDELLARLAQLEASGVPEAALIVVTGPVTPSRATAVVRSSRRYRHVTVVSVVPGSAPSADGTLLTRAGIRAVVVGPDTTLDRAWTRPRPLARPGRSWDLKPARA